MANKSKNIGTAGETATVRAIRPRGFPRAERAALCGENDCGDLTGTPGICWQVKAGEAAKSASDNQVLKWLEDLERQRRNRGADVGVLVLQRSGIGAPNAHMWWAVVTAATLDRLAGGRLYPLHLSLALQGAPVRLHLRDMCSLLVAAGYGTPLAATA